MRTKLLGFGAGIVGAAMSAHAALSVSVGHDFMTPNSTQSFAITISDTDNAHADDIEGMTFTLQIAGGTGSTPSVTGLDMLTNTVWTGLVTGPVLTAAGGSTPEFTSDDLITNNGGEYLGEFSSPSGTLATITFNSNGASAGDYALLLVGTLDPGSDSQFTNGSGNPVAAVFNAGILTIQTGVPEATGICVVAACAMPMLRRSRRMVA